MKKIGEITEKGDWSSEAKKILEINSFSPEFVENFHTTWIVNGHHIRAQIKSDELLVKLLEHVLPIYSGANINLYRGENLDRWESNYVGLCWTPLIKVAQMFGRGLNAVGNGGVLLSCYVEKESIIAGPNEHSMHLGEHQYTVNPKKLREIKTIEIYLPN